MDDWQQLREYVEHGSETAFSAIVHRHLGLVYSVAWRILGNAEDSVGPKGRAGHPACNPTGLPAGRVASPGVSRVFPGIWPLEAA